MFRVSQHPSSGVLKTVPAASVTGHTTCTATPLQRDLIGKYFILNMPHTFFDIYCEYRFTILLKFFKHSALFKQSSQGK